MASPPPCLPVGPIGRRPSSHYLLNGRTTDTSRDLFSRSPKKSLGVEHDSKSKKRRTKEMATKKGNAVMDWENAADYSATTVFYRTLNGDGLKIFYREAGPRDAPAVLLLHGFPSSSHMFRNLIPMLADKYHVVAPDFPGYGESSAPSVDDFDYSFEPLASVT